MSGKTKYLQAPDGMRAMVIGEWGKEKYTLLRNYIQSSSGARAKWPKRAYVDLYCGPGQVVYRNSKEFADGGALVAWKQSVASGAPFTHIFISDLDAENVAACEKRLKAANAPVISHVGAAAKLAPVIAAQLPKSGLHLGFFDPFSISALPFRTLVPFAAIKTLDMIVNYAAGDQQRNLDSMMIGKFEGLDQFAPGWQQVIDANRPAKAVRLQLVNYWRELLTGAGIQYAQEMPLIVNSRRGPLYWLVFASHHPLADKLWKSINVGHQGTLDFQE